MSSQENDRLGQSEIEQIEQFAKAYYHDKDIMHDWSHIERIALALHKLQQKVNLSFDFSITYAALCLHGFIYSHESLIVQQLTKISLSQESISLLTKVAWESQKESRPTTAEGLMLHDAHMLEGGKNFEIIKSLITGSVRGQSLEETMLYIENNLLDKGVCYTEVGQLQYAEMKKTTLKIFTELQEALNL